MNNRAKTIIHIVCGRITSRQPYIGWVGINEVPVDRRAKNTNTNATYTHTHTYATHLCNLEWTHDEFIRVNILERFEFYHIFDGLKTGRWSNMRDRLETAKVSV